MDDCNRGPTNHLTRAYDKITGGDLGNDSPEYIWDSEYTRAKRISLLTDWIRSQSEEDYIKIKEVWFKAMEMDSIELNNSDATKIINSFVDKRDLAKQFLQIQPLYYNKSKMWWMWIEQEKKWLIVDDVDVLNLISKHSYANTIRPHERNEIIEGMKQEGRKLEPLKGGKTWVQFKDIIINIKTNKEIKATSKYFITNPIPFKLGDEEDTPMMDKLFKEWVGEEYVQTLYEILAYCCLPDYPIHRIFCFIGSGCNGKTQFLNLLRKFIGGGNCCSTELETLLYSRFEKTRLYKKLVCQMGETNFNEMSQTSLLKKLCGGDLIGFEFKNKDPFDDENYAKIIIATNTLPTTTDKTIGFYRRWLIVDFPNRFDEKNGNIIEKIPLEEYNNLAKKCVRILKYLLKEFEFNKEGSIEERTEKYEEKSNPFEKFWKLKIDEDYDGHIFKFDFKDEFDSWCKSNGLRKMSDKEIKHKMDEKNVETVRRDWFGNNDDRSSVKRYMAWGGIKFKVIVNPVNPVNPSLLHTPPIGPKSDKVDILDRVDSKTTNTQKHDILLPTSVEENPQLKLKKGVQFGQETPKCEILKQENIRAQENKEEKLIIETENFDDNITKTNKNMNLKKEILNLIPLDKEKEIQYFCINCINKFKINEQTFNEKIEELKAEGLIIETKPGKVIRL